MSIDCIGITRNEQITLKIKTYVESTECLRLSGNYNTPSAALAAFREASPKIILTDPEIMGEIFSNFYKQYPISIRYIIFSGNQTHFVDNADESEMRFFFPPLSPPLSNPPVFVRSESRIHRIDLDKLVYVEAHKDYVALHTENEVIRTLNSMKNLEVQLPQEQFIRIHRSFIARIDKITQIHGDTIFTPAGKLPIGPSFRQKLMQNISFL